MIRSTNQLKKNNHKTSKIKENFIQASLSGRARFLIRNKKTQQQVTNQLGHGWCDAILNATI
jgi:hypothetical protein